MHSKKFTQSLLGRIPPQHRHKMVEMKNRVWGGFRHHHYSQFGEDIVIQHLLPQEWGFYVDVGAHHPRRYSNTQLLYERGWNGINVDPNADAMQVFARERGRDINISCGVGIKKDTLTYYRFSDPAFNTFSKERAVELGSKGWLAPLGPKKVEIVPLSEILREHVPHGIHIDLINIDTEGRDLEVLESNDWTSFTPRVIAVEDSVFDSSNPDGSVIWKYLREKGYSLRSYIGKTLILTHVSLKK